MYNAEQLHKKNSSNLKKEKKINGIFYICNISYYDNKYTCKR